MRHLRRAGQLDYIMSVNALADYLAGIDMFDREHQGWKAQGVLLDRQVYPKLGEPPAFTFDESTLTGQSSLHRKLCCAARQSAACCANHARRRPATICQRRIRRAYKLILEPARALYALQPFGAVAAGTNIATDYQIGPRFVVTAAELNSGVRRILRTPVSAPVSPSLANSARPCSPFRTPAIYSCP